MSKKKKKTILATRTKPFDIGKVALKPAKPFEIGKVA